MKVDENLQVFSSEGGGGVMYKKSTHITQFAINVLHIIQNVNGRIILYPH